MLGLFFLSLSSIYPLPGYALDFDERPDTLGLWWKHRNVGLSPLVISIILIVSSSFGSFSLVGRQMREAEIQAQLIYTRFLGFTSRLVCHDCEAISAKNQYTLLI